MRSGMGNLLETDSDVASISDNERERTDGDGMESDNHSVISKTVSVSKDEESENSNSNISTGNLMDPNKAAHAPLTNRKLETMKCTSSIVLPSSSSPKPSCSGSSSTKILCSEKLKSTTVPTNTGKIVAFSPRELPPRNQLIQLKPILLKPKVITKAPSETLPDAANKQKNPRFVPYEPYRGAVRPMVAQGETSKRHSRSTSDASASSSAGLEQAMSSIVLVNSPQELPNAQKSTVKHNAQIYKSLEQERSTSGNINWSSDISNQLKKHEKIVEKQTHALSLLKERLKIAEKDNNDLHRENIRLKKLLVDSLSGDILQGRFDAITHEAINFPTATSDSVDTLSNEIEVWRSKFLSSCVLVEQLTRENGALNDSIGTAANILKEIKLSSSLSPELFEEVNTWIRTNRGVTPPQNNNVGDM